VEMGGYYYSSVTEECVYISGSEHVDCFAVVCASHKGMHDGPSAYGQPHT
jgi:hypothetical protein